MPIDHRRWAEQVIPDLTVAEHSECWRVNSQYLARVLDERSSSLMAGLQTALHSPVAAARNTVCFHDHIAARNTLLWYVGQRRVSPNLQTEVWGKMRQAVIGQMREGKLIKGVQRNTADVQRGGRVVCRGMPYRSHSDWSAVSRDRGFCYRESWTSRCVLVAPMLERSAEERSVLVRVLVLLQRFSKLCMHPRDQGA